MWTCHICLCAQGSQMKTKDLLELKFQEVVICLILVLSFGRFQNVLDAWAISPSPIVHNFIYCSSMNISVLLDPCSPLTFSIINRIGLCSNKIKIQPYSLQTCYIKCFLKLLIIGRNYFLMNWEVQCVHSALKASEDNIPFLVQHPLTPQLATFSFFYIILLGEGGDIYLYWINVYNYYVLLFITKEISLCAFALYSINIVDRFEMGVIAQALRWTKEGK